jgi:transglutaminase-like putative cysteine protease
MYVRIGFDLQYDLPAQTPMLLMLHTHPQHLSALRRPDRVCVEPTPAHHEIFLDGFGNRCSRILAPAGHLRLTYDNIILDSGRHEPTIEGAQLHRVEELPPDTIPFLLASRYCEVDILSQMAWDLFAKTPPTWERVQAVMDWAHDRIEFGYPYASSTKTAVSVCEERKGVCRDFQHLAIAMLRALNVPARYATGYLGDIGVPPNPSPMDFSAWLEVYLGGRWYALDARHNTPRIARVLMARGRDATDVALTTSFGPSKLTKFVVWTDELDPAAVAKLDSEAIAAAEATCMGAARCSGQQSTTHSGDRLHRNPVEGFVNPDVAPSRPATAAGRAIV